MQVFDMTEEQLRDCAKRYEIDSPRTMKRQELEDAVQIAINKRQFRLEEKAKAERMLELQKQLGIDPASKKVPAPETIAISNSEKKYYVFMNLEERGTDIPFNWGCTHSFHLWDGFIHVLPKCIVDKLNDSTNPMGKRPRYGRRQHQSIPNLEIDTIIGHERRFSFEPLDIEPPKNAEFGVVLKRSLYDKLGVPFPEPVSHAE
jgi:hypothetical protein